MKKLFATLLVLAMTLSLCAVAFAEEPVTIQFLVGSDSTGFTEQLVADFEAANPGIKVEINYIPGNTDDVKKSLINSLNAGDSDPDVFLTDIVWTGQFAAAQWIKDLSGQFDDSIHSEGALQSCTYNGAYYAIPVYTDIQLFIYRNDIIGEDEVPKTWDELLAVCEKYVGQDGINYGWLWQGKQAEAVVCNAASFIGSNGGAFVRDGEIVCNSAETVEAVQFMKDMNAIYETWIFPNDKRYGILQPAYNMIKKAGLNAYMDRARWKEYSVSQKILAWLKHGAFFAYIDYGNHKVKRKNEEANGAG